jgi:hypothetical protein
LLSSSWTLGSPGRGQPGNVEGFFDHHWDPEQRLPLTAGERGVGGLGPVAGTVEVTHHDRVEAWIERVDARDDMLSELDRRNLSGLQCFNKFIGRAVLPLRSRNRSRLLSKSSASPSILRDSTSDRYRTGRNQKVAPTFIFHDSTLPQLFLCWYLQIRTAARQEIARIRMTPKTALQLVDDHAGNKRTSVMRILPADGITLPVCPERRPRHVPFQRAASDSLRHFTVYRRAEAGPGPLPDYQSPKGVAATAAARR